MIDFNIILGLLFGLLGTCILHLSKSMERHGIEIFDTKKELKEKDKKPLIWMIGFILNNTIFIYQLAGTYYANASVYSSVFGVGLIVLLIYSINILKEKLSKWDWLGSGLIIIGTLLIGITFISRSQEFLTPSINWDVFFTLMVVSTIIFSIMLIFGRFVEKRSIPLLFGLVAGSLGSMDNIWKHLGLTTGNFYITILSFALGGLSFLTTQWGFANQADASKLVPCYNSAYIIIPVLFESWIIPSISTQIQFLQIFAMVIIIIGIFSMTAIKKWWIGKINGIKK
ncbi:MAG: EamA family transporter [Candidatus Helarchaeota archaeon]